MAGGAVVAGVPATGIRLLLTPGTLLWAGILVGLLIVVMGGFLWLQPELRHILGVAVILLAMTSFVTSDFGGLFVGMLLSMLGGSLALAWTHVEARRPAAAPAAAPVPAADARPVGPRPGAA